jgi:predicted Zn-dependent protease
VRWAFDTWSNASEAALEFVEIDTESDAVIRVYWAGRNTRKYGEMRAIEVDGKRGAEVYINPSTEGLGDDVHARAMRDRLFRDSVVFLTCVHEIGHAIGLSHTDNFADIMYSFQYGGDIESYFLRYRMQVKNREHMRERSPLSDNDIARLRAPYH